MSQAEALREALSGARTIAAMIETAASAFDTAQLFYGHGTDNPWDEARWLVLGALDLPFDSEEAALDAGFSPEQRARVESLVVQRIEQRIPVAYLLGEAWFAGLRFRVDGHVLIPRSPIAELIANGFSPWYTGPGPVRILDLCCGCGCIGIAAALQFPDTQVELSDISPAALALARENVELHGLGARVTVIESDLFAALAGRQYDLILCNPPYVDQPDMDALPPEFSHEPRMALAAGADGLDLVRGILAQARTHLTDDGLLVLEVGNSAEALENAYPRLPLLWPEFEHGGHGVALIGAQDLAGNS